MTIKYAISQPPTRICYKYCIGEILVLCTTMCLCRLLPYYETGQFTLPFMHKQLK